MGWTGAGCRTEAHSLLPGGEWNITNANAIAEIAGSDDTDEWSGLAICLYSCRVQFGSKMVDAIRIQPATRETVAVPVDDDGNEFPNF